MYKAILDTALHQVGFQSVIFRIGNLAVDFGIFISAAAGNVLVHQTEHNLSRLKGAGNPVNDALGIIKHSRHNQMADDDTLGHDAVIAYVVVTNLAVHLLDGLCGNAEVVGRVAVFDGGNVVAVF